MNTSDARQWVRDKRIELAALRRVSRNGKVQVPITDLEEILKATDLLLAYVEAFEGPHP